MSLDAIQTIRRSRRVLAGISALVALDVAVLVFAGGALVQLASAVADANEHGVKTLGLEAGLLMGGVAWTAAALALGALFVAKSRRLRDGR